MQAIPQTDEAQRDTLITTAYGEAFSVVSRQAGVPWPTNFNIREWRKALKAVAYGPRGTPGATFAFLDGLFFDERRVFDVDRAAATPTRITATSGDASFAQADIGRWVRVDGVVYRIEGPKDIATSGGVWVTLAPIATAYWAAADWLADDTVEAEILAFTITEPSPGPLPVGVNGVQPTGNNLVVVTPVSSKVSGVPPTYMQPAGAAVRPAGQPFGGQVQINEFEPTSQTVGPYPPYLSGDKLLGAPTDIFDLLLASGNRAQFNITTAAS